MRIVVDATAAVRQQAGVGRFARGLLSGLAALDAHNDYTLLTTGRARQRPLPSALPVHHRWLQLPISERVARIAWHRLVIGPPPTLLVRRPELFFTPDYALPPVGSVPAVLTIHDLSFLVYPECADAGLRRYLEQSVPRSIARATAVVAVSETTARALHDRLKVEPERIHVVPNGVGPQFSPLEPPGLRGSGAPGMRLARHLHERFGIDPGYLLHVGTLEPRKNLVRLLQAFNALRRRKREAAASAAGDAPVPFARLQLVLAGREGWLYEPIFKEVARLGLRECVRFLTRVDDDDLVSLYRGALAFIYPSLYEGFGIPPLEAMACGVPVAASTGGALAEVLDGAAEFFDPVDVDAMVGAMDRVLADAPVRARLISRGRQRAQEYTWERAGRAALMLFDRTAA
jgi:glycosyltransferase involved in cell wall biosynthesis